MPPKSVNVAVTGAGNGKKWKMVMLKVAGTIVVAMLGLIGTGLGYLAQVKTGNTDDVLKVIVEQLNTRTIPLLGTLLKEQRVESSKLRDKLSEACERLAYLEAFTKSLGTKIRVKPPAVDKITVGAAMVMDDIIPRLEVLQIQLVQPE